MLVRRGTQAPSWIHYVSPVTGAGSETKQVSTSCSLNEWLNERHRALTQPCLSPTPTLHCVHCTLYLESVSLSYPILFSFIIDLSVHGPGQITAPSETFLDVGIHLSPVFWILFVSIAFMILLHSGLDYSFWCAHFFLPHRMWILGDRRKILLNSASCIILWAWKGLSKFYLARIPSSCTHLLYSPSFALQFFISLSSYLTILFQVVTPTQAPHVSHVSSSDLLTTPGTLGPGPPLSFGAAKPLHFPL